MKKIVSYLLFENKSEVNELFSELRKVSNVQVDENASGYKININMKVDIDNTITDSILASNAYIVNHLRTILASFSESNIEVNIMLNKHLYQQYRGKNLGIVYNRETAIDDAILDNSDIELLAKIEAYN